MNLQRNTILHFNYFLTLHHASSFPRPRYNPSIVHHEHILKKATVHNNTSDDIFTHISSVYHKSVLAPCFLLLTRNDVVKASDRTYTHVPINATNVLALLRRGDDLLLKTRSLLLRHTIVVASILGLVYHHNLLPQCQ